MAFISKIRENVGLVIGLIGLALVAFILTDLFQSSTSFMRAGGDIIGEVSGTEVKYQEFNELYQKGLAAEQKNATEITDDQRYAVLDRTWNQFVDDYINNHQYSSSGINISGREVLDMFTGPNPNQYVYQEFTRNGQAWDVNRVKQVLKNSQTNAELKSSLAVFEDFIVKQRKQEKFLNLLKGAMFASDNEALRKYNDENTKISFNFLSVNYGVLTDSLYKVTDEEIQKYINEHSKQYQNQLTATLKFVEIPKLPNQRDSVEALTYIENLIESFKNTKSNSSFIGAKSSEKFDTLYKAYGELEPKIQTLLEGVEKDSVIGPVFEDRKIRLVKITDIKSDSLPRIKLKHILITPKGMTPKDTSDALAQAIDLSKKAASGDFNQLVAEFSDDGQTKYNGGDLGWYTRGKYKGEFDKKLDQSPIGKPSVIKSDQGFHVVVVLDKTSKLYQVGTVVRNIYAGSNTVRELFRRADKLKNALAEGRNFDETCKKAGIEVKTSQAISPSSHTVSNIKGTQQVCAWAMDGKKGDISKVFETESSFIIALIDVKTEKGTKTVEEARPLVEKKIMNEKKAVKIIEDLNKIKSKDLQQIKAAYKEGSAYVSNVKDADFSMSFIPGLGSEPKVLGTVCSLSKGQISKPIEGMNGIYIVQVTDVVKPSAPAGEAIAKIKETALSSKKSQITSKAPNGIKDQAEVKDLRYKFF
jgi:peptidyl-prolyl cis-trans isomerase D